VPDLGHKKMGFLLASIATIFKHISWLVSERIHNRVNEPLLCPKNGIVKIYGPSVYCEVCFNMVWCNLENTVEDEPIWMAVSSKMLSPHSWQQPIGIASATDYSIAGSTPATILKHLFL
jgi:hypothetical protein